MPGQGTTSGATNTTVDKSDHHIGYTILIIASLVVAFLAFAVWWCFKSEDEAKQRQAMREGKLARKNSDGAPSGAHAAADMARKNSTPK